MSVEKILSDWKKGQYKPIYWIEGDEPFFIDQIINYAEHSILNESEAGFNLTVFYGRDAEWTAVINACRRYPMFAEKQVVVLKEAQHMKQIEMLESYILNPLSSTIFVVGFKDKKLDGRGTLSKAVKKKTEYLESKKIADYKLAEWARGMIEGKGFVIADRTLQLLIDHIGNDLSRLQNEVDKIWLNLGTKKTIDENDVERYVGISKDYNAFELQAAIAKKDMAKAIRIIQYFQSNPKSVPIQLVLPALYGYFSKLYTILGMSDRSEFAIKPIFSNNGYAAKEALVAANAFGQQGVEKILLLLHEYNLRSVGVNDGDTTDADLLKEMVAKIIF